MKLSSWLIIAATVPFLTQCAKPAPRPEWAFDISIQMTPEALANLKGDKKVSVNITYFGRVVPGGRQEADAFGRILLGTDQFSANYDNPHLHLTGGSIDQSLLGDVMNGEINLRIMVDSLKARRPNEPPYVECRNYYGTITAAHMKAPVITCDKYRP